MGFGQLWCQCRFTTCNKGTMLMGGVDNGGDCVCVWAEGIWEISAFAVNLKLLFKKVLKKYIHVKTCM